MECDIRIHIYIKVNYEKSGKLKRKPFVGRIFQNNCFRNLKYLYIRKHVSEI